MTKEFQLADELAQTSIVLTQLPLCSLLLANDSNYPWFILVPRRADVSEIFQLDWQDQQQLLNESSLLAELIAQEFSADKINIAALGNMVPQLHLHHVVRYKTDVAWPNPIWGASLATQYTEKQVDEVRQRVVNKLQVIMNQNSQ